MLKTDIIIRKELSADHSAILRVTRLAFAAAPYADGNEHELVDKLHASDEFIPELSLVAEYNGKVVGHIMFSRARIIGEESIYPSLTLAPVSVHPDYQNQGIGSQLIKEGIKIAKIIEYKSICVLGHSEYYPRFGFKNAKEFNISLPFEVPYGAFMCMELQAGALKGIAGTFQFAKEFNI